MILGQKAYIVTNTSYNQIAYSSMGKINILLLTPGYKADDTGINASPVINFFAKDWVRLGYNVRVIHLHAKFPVLMRWIAKMNKKRLESKLSVTICTKDVKERRYVDEIVPVYRIPLFKLIPHGKFLSRTIKVTSLKILNYCKEQGFKPDVIISHWVNPCIDIMLELKKEFKVPVVDVLHSNGDELAKLYGVKAREVVEKIDIWGYRSKAIKQNFEAVYGIRPKWVFSYSGIPDCYISNNTPYRKYDFKNRFIYVGNLRARKNPVSVIEAISKCYSKEDSFSLTYVGVGAGESLVKEVAVKHGFSAEQLRMPGFVAREQVRKMMQESDVFVLISRNEVYGLVYLEAMSVGCITVASKREGFDGIIEDGVNGFLCEAGNADELSLIIEKIRNMSPDERQMISNKAMDTAKRMTDSQVAKDYIESVLKQC